MWRPPPGLRHHRSDSGPQGLGRQQHATGETGGLFKLTKYEAVLTLLFVLTLPLSNPWIRGDGVGYYAWARSILIEHRPDFTQDWLAANESFRMGRVGTNGHLTADQYTPTGHIDNHFAVGPAILWSPFLVAAHAGVLLYDHAGGRVPADGFSRPYRVAMAFGTAFYGFLGVLISFRLGRRWVSERWAFLASLGIWFGSSLPVYMYFNPSWSHAPSAFAVALFVWYWAATRSDRKWQQWVLLGLLGGVMMDCYYLNTILILLPVIDSVAGYRAALSARARGIAGKLLASDALFCLALLCAFLPTLITKKIIYGSYLNFGYGEHWFWRSPALFQVCFSSNHGLFSWTPVLILSAAGLLLLQERDRGLAFSLLAVFAVYLYAMGCYQDWNGISSFGNRFFVSLTVVFVVGLAGFFQWLADVWQVRRAAILAWGGTAALVLWNLGLIFQWGMHLIPDRGSISWREAAVNQFAVVPTQAAQSLNSYFLHRHQLMNRIEEKDVNQIKSHNSGAPNE